MDILNWNAITAALDERSVRLSKERVKLLLAGREQRDARIAELRAANAGCR